MSGKNLRVLIDATAVPPDRRGVGTYVDSLLPALETRGLTLMIVCRPDDLDHYRQLCPRSDLLPGPHQIDSRPVRLAWEQTGFAAMIAKTNASVIHSPHYTQPVLTKKPVVVTLHDATFFTHPQLHQRAKRIFFGNWTKRSLGHAARCIVPSQATADELVRVAGAQRDRLNVIHLGVNEQTFREPTDAQVAAARELLGLPDRPYIAFLGTL
ncbi:MAG: glycosyltransferase, partial [Antricoccus sp.]